MAYIQSRTCRQVVFSNKSVLTLLEDIGEFFTRTPERIIDIEKYLETIAIEYVNQDNLYIASVYIHDINDLRIEGINNE